MNTSQSRVVVEAAFLPNDQPAVAQSRISTGTSQEYIERSALTAARASSGDQYLIAFMKENGTLPSDATQEQISKQMFKTKLERIRRKIKDGGVVVECADFSVMACWSPPNPSVAHYLDQQVRNLDFVKQPIYAPFQEAIYAARAKHLYPRYGDRYWNLSLMARDPSVPRIPGAVRAAMHPFMQKARENHEAIWLEASNIHSRDVYTHFGFRTVDVIFVETAEFSCMIWEP